MVVCSTAQANRLLILQPWLNCWLEDVWNYEELQWDQISVAKKEGLKKKKKSPSRSLEDLSFVSAGRDVFKILSKPHSYEIFDLKRLLKKSGCNWNLVYMRSHKWITCILYITHIVCLYAEQSLSLAISNKWQYGQWLAKTWYALQCGINLHACPNYPRFLHFIHTNTVYGFNHSSCSLCVSHSLGSS